jgi:hypothetical protein
MQREIISSENFVYDNVVMCKMDLTDVHVLKSPKVLPCGISIRLLITII